MSAAKLIEQTTTICFEFTFQVYFKQQRILNVILHLTAPQ